MTKMSMNDYMAGIPLFRGLPRQQIEELADIVVDQTLLRGKTIFSEGDKASGLYVVISGKIKVFKLSSEGKEQIIHIFKSGDPFGEVPMLTGGNFPANAETLEKSRIFFFPRTAFIDLITREPSLALNMLAAMARLMKQLTSLIEDLSLKEVPGRLSAYLLYLSKHGEDSDCVELDIAKGQLASLLGTIPETVSRILNKMSSQELIQVKGRRIMLLNRKALGGIASGGKFL